MNISNLTHELPYHFMVQDACFLKDGSIFIGMKCSGIDSYPLSDQELDQLKSNFKNIIGDLKRDLVIQFFHDYDKKYFDNIDKSSHPEVKDYFKESYQNYISNEIQVYESNLYIFVILKPQGKTWDLSQVFNQRDKNDELPSDHIKNLYKELNRQIDIFVNSFQQNQDIQIEKMSKDEIYSILFKFYNPDQDFNANSNLNLKKNITLSPFKTIREYLLNSPMEIYSDKIKMGNTYYRVLKLNHPSASTHPADDEAILGQIDFPISYSLSFKIIDSTKINSKLERMINRKDAFLRGSKWFSMDAGLSRDHLEQALTDQKTHGFSWHQAQLTILIKAENEEDLESRTNTIQSIFRQFQDARISSEKFNQKNSFINHLPGGAIYGEFDHLLSSLNVIDLAPISVPSTGMSKGHSHFLTTRNTLFNYHTFSDEINRWSQVFIGKTGSGKSFLVNSILNRALMNLEKPKVMIVDLGESFRRTVEFWGGHFTSIDLDNPVHSLPVLPPHTFFKSKDDEYAHGMVDFTVRLLLLMAGVEANKIDQMIIRKTLMKVYETITHRDPILEDLYHLLIDYYNKVDSDKDDSQRALYLSKLLSDFVYGPYAPLFNRPSNLNISSDIFCVDFKNAHANAELRELATYVVGGYIYQKMTADKDPKFVIFDEFDTTMRHETGASLCKMIAKNCRKHHVSFNCISQELEDFLHSPAARAVYQQAEYKWFLNLDDDLEKYRDHLQLSSEDIQIIKNLKTQKGKFSEVYFKYKNKKARLTNFCDPFLYWTCTSDPLDMKMESIYRDKYSNKTIPEIAFMLASNFPRGVSSDDLEGM